MLSPSTTHLSSSPSSSSPPAPPTSSPSLQHPSRGPLFFYVLLSWDTGSFEVNRSLLRLLLLLLLCCFTLLLVLAEKSTRKCLKLGSTSFFVSRFLFLTFVRAAPNVWVMRCNRLLAFIHYDLAPLSHAWFSFLFSISSAYLLIFLLKKKNLIHFPFYLSVEHTKPLIETLVKGHWKGRVKSNQMLWVALQDLFFFFFFFF